MSIFGLISLIIIILSSSILIITARFRYKLDRYVSELDNLFFDRIEILMDISLEVDELYELLEEIYITGAIKEKLPTAREHFLSYKDILLQSEELTNNTNLIRDKLQKYPITPFNMFVAKIIGLEIEKSLDNLLGEPF